MEASQRYPNTIQQAIAHTYMGCPYAYGIGIRPIRVWDNIRILGRTLLWITTNQLNQKAIQNIAIYTLMHTLQPR